MNVEALLPALRRVVNNDESSGLSVADALQMLDAAAKDAALEVDPLFRHYLKNRSYVKALAFLETGEKADHG